MMTRDLYHNKSRKIYMVFSAGGSATLEVSGDDEILATVHHYTIRTPSPQTFNEWSPTDCISTIVNKIYVEAEIRRCSIHI
jgi:inorganic pyrophosphatase/exopolyphosphatase